MLNANSSVDFLCFSEKLPVFLKSCLYDYGLSCYIHALNDKYTNLLLTYNIIDV